MTTSEYILNQVQETLGALENNSAPLSSITQRCVRIARLRNDYLNLWWLSFEIINMNDKSERNRVLGEFLPHLTKELFEHFNKKFVEAWMNEREIVEITKHLEVVEGDKIAAQSIGEIEVEIAHYTQLGDQAHVPGGLHPLDLYYAEQDAKQTRYIALVRVKGYKAILERIKSRIHDFLSQTEKQLLYGQIHADIFEQNRQYVDLKLGELCPDALAKFISAYQRMKEDEPESWAQALTSCRRLLKSLTDVLYPAQDKPVIGHDGKERTLTDELYISRLWQYIFEQTSHSASGELLLVEVKDLGDRLDRIYDLACKGVHDEISKVEVNQCVIQTYILIGDLLRISEKVTAVGMEIH